MGIVTTLRELAVEGGLARRVPEDVSPELARELGDAMFKELGMEQRELNNRAVEAVDNLPEAV